MEFDALDKRILNVIQKDASVTMEELAHRVGSTAATCHRRYQTLLKKGVIERKVAIVDPNASDEAFTIIIGIMVKDQRPAEQTKFRRFLKGHENIKFAWMTTGEFDYIAVGAFPDTAAYKNFIDVELINNANFSNFRTYISLEDVKFDTARLFS